MSLILKCNGYTHEGWEDVRVTRSMETLAGGFQITYYDKWGTQEESRTIYTGDACEVIMYGQTIITGYVDTASINYDGSSHTLSITGRDKTGDLVDCSAIYQTGQFNNQKIEAILSSLCKPFGIKVTTASSTGASIQKFNINPGETVHEVIERLCKLQGLLCIADKKGNLTLIRGGEYQNGGRLIEGVNILSGSVESDFKDRFSQITVKGQEQSSGTNPGLNAYKATASAKDLEVKRYRPLIVIAEEQASTARCAERASWEVATRCGRSRRFEITVLGWRSEAGKLWDINQKVQIDAPNLGVSETLIISEVTYTSDSQGEKTHLTLLRPEAYLQMKELPEVKKLPVKKLKKPKKDKNSLQPSKTGKDKGFGV
jgi:prophage tail gpP-like protein